MRYFGPRQVEKSALGPGDLGGNGNASLAAYDLRCLDHSARVVFALIRSGADYRYFHEVALKLDPETVFSHAHGNAGGDPKGATEPCDATF